VLTSFLIELWKNRTLKSLELKSILLSKEAMEFVGEFVKQNFGLQRLGLSWSKVRWKDLEGLVRRIKGIKHLQYLDVSGIPFEGAYAMQLAEGVKNHVVYNSSLVHLDLSWWFLDSDEIDVLVQGIKRSKSLLAVHLSGNSMTQETKEFVILVLTKNKIVKKLSLKVISPLTFRIWLKGKILNLNQLR
jgi:Ran GTPase-activating protein (RanGAP) involved in mRNA processing and transport